MANQQSKSEIRGSIAEVGAALFELRDALAELSLALRDWQFETDLEQRKIAENAVCELLQQISSGRGPSS